MYKYYKYLLIASAPFFAWTAFEMYGLTVFGPQMLFYSILHTMPILIVIVFLSAMFYLVLFILNIHSKLFSNIKWLEKSHLMALILMQFLHVTLLVSYDFWAHSILRIPICIAGLIMLFYGSYKIKMNAFKSNKITGQISGTNQQL